MSVFFNFRRTIHDDFRPINTWVLLSSIEVKIKEKIEKIGMPLKEWNIEIYRGILTGLNEAFIIDSKTKDYLLQSSPNNAEIIRPILRGRDIKKFKVDFSNKWLINSHNGLKGLKIPRVDVNKFPEILNHLEQYKSALDLRLDKGDEWFNLRNCAYINEFEKPKVVWQELSRSGSAFCYVESPMYLTNTAYALTGGDETELMYLTAVLNSYLSLFYLEIVYNKLDETGWRWLKNAVEKIPIPKIQNPGEIASLVKKIQILNAEGQPAEKEELELRHAVYAIYGISEAEAAFLKGKYNNEQEILFNIPNA